MRHNVSSFFHEHERSVGLIMLHKLPSLTLLACEKKLYNGNFTVDSLRGLSEFHYR